eukprot:gb/GECH01001088.1/.p1 GENE.gb/GECH01001088.1/~~gb/GECH01001088.1/.p1  ORF type:complete len:331 (+),score=43.29 gb/GECH01001088.1/:1-993(+)
MELRLFIAVCFLIWFVTHSLKRQSLSVSGAVAACMIGGITLLAGGPILSSHLLAFFFSASRLTKVGRRRKATVEANHGTGEGSRNWEQVMACGGMGAVLSLWWWQWNRILSEGMSTYANDDDGGGGEGIGNPKSMIMTMTTTLMPPMVGLDAERAPYLTVIIAAHLSWYASHNADTWASELGILSSSPPRHILTFQPVPAGTNGGVSWTGLLASLLGGITVAAAHVIAWILFAAPSYPDLPAQIVPVLVLGAGTGLVGSITDSVLGAGVEFSGVDRQGRVVGTRDRHRAIRRITRGRPWLTGEQVNFVSALLTAWIGGAAGLYLFRQPLY